MKVYRIYTEDINRETIETLADEMLPEYTIYNAVGKWDHVKENSLILEYIDFGSFVSSEHDMATIIWNVATAIKKLNNQQVVLTTVQDIQATLV